MISDMIGPNGQQIIVSYKQSGSRKNFSYFLSALCRIIQIFVPLKVL